MGKYDTLANQGELWLFFLSESGGSLESGGMHLSSILDSEIFRWVILPILIFLARIFDVTIGTVRIMFVARGDKLLAPLLGFFEVLVWLLAIGQIMQNLTNVFCYIAYAGGFATGNYIGILVEERLALGKLVVRVITQKGGVELVRALRQKGFGATSVDAEGSRGPVKVVFAVINRYDLQRIVDTIHRFNPKAFYSIEDTRLVRAGIFRNRRGLVERVLVRPLRLPHGWKMYRRLRKGK
jgi:uncharacterized protein YebE (UPF0316 family)